MARTTARARETVKTCRCAITATFSPSTKICVILRWTLPWCVYKRLFKPVLWLKRFRDDSVRKSLRKPHTYPFPFGDHFGGLFVVAVHPLPYYPRTYTDVGVVHVGKENWLWTFQWRLMSAVAQKNRPDQPGKLSSVNTDQNLNHIARVETDQKSKRRRTYSGFAIEEFLKIS